MHYRETLTLNGSILPVVIGCCCFSPCLCSVAAFWTNCKKETSTHTGRTYTVQKGDVLPNTLFFSCKALFRCFHSSILKFFPYVFVHEVESILVLTQHRVSQQQQENLFHLFVDCTAMLKYSSRNTRLCPWKPLFEIYTVFLNIIKDKLMNYYMYFF